MFIDSTLKSHLVGMNRTRTGNGIIKVNIYRFDCFIDIELNENNS